MIHLPQPPSGERGGRNYGWWLDRAFADEVDVGVRRLTGELGADIAIVGGGYVGLWAAIRIAEAEPGASVVVLEADLCGSGASGRNGGFAFGWWPKVETLVERAGDVEALRLGRAAEAAVRDLGEFCEAEGIDAAYRRGGWLWTATSAAQAGAWRGAIRECARLGVDPFEEIDPDEVCRRTGSPIHVGGVYEREAATVHPAKLVRGLLQVARRRGVEVYERSPVTRVDPDAGLLVAAAGRVSAKQVVLATNAWLAGLPELRRAVLPLSSDVVATMPMPAQLAAAGWTGGESISDSRLMVNYYRTTADGRIVFGKGGGGLGGYGHFRGGFDRHERRAARVAAELHRLCPASRGVPIAAAWGGAVDRSSDGLPFFGRLRGTGVFYGVGFSGNGVVPSLLAGRILCSLALGRNDEWTCSALAQGIPGKFPPEPVRMPGGVLVREAVRRKESLEDAGRHPSPVVKRLAALAPSGFFKVNADE